MVESTLWHPVALSEAVAAQSPLAVQLLEQPVVLWRDSGGAVHALADQCPHRGAGRGGRALPLHGSARIWLGPVRHDALHPERIERVCPGRDLVEGPR